MAWEPESIYAKLARVQENLDALDRENGAYIASNPYEVVPEFDPESGWHTIKLAVRPPGPAFGLIIGEAAHNLRSALDHLAWQLANLDGPPPNPERVQFPIYSWRPQNFSGLPAVNGMRSEHIALLESFQPYHAGHGNTYLEQLSWINNTDKHRLLHTTASLAGNLVPEALKPHPGYEIDASEFGYRGVLVDGTEVGKIRVRPTNPELKVHMRLAPSIGVAFGDPDSPAYGFAAGGLLQKIADAVAQLIRVFDRPGANGKAPWP